MKTNTLVTQILLVMEELYKELKVAKIYSISGLLKRNNYNSYINKALFETKILTLVKKQGRNRVYKWTNMDTLPNEANAQLVAAKVKDLIPTVKSLKQKTALAPSNRKMLYELEDLELLKVLVNRGTPWSKMLLAKGADAIRKAVKEFEEQIVV